MVRPPITSDQPSPLADCRPQAGVLADPDALAALVSFLQREWGHTGYTLTLVAWVSGAVVDINRPVLLALATHRDGSRFHIAADRWGNGYYVGAVR